MPLVHVHLARGRTATARAAILDGVHAALVEAFRLPADDRNQILHQHEPEDFQARRGNGAVFVEITAFPGRSPAAKKALFAAVVRNLAAAGVEPAAVLTVIHEPPLESWGIRGGLPASEVDLGFTTRV
ncbi:MAG: tautomerase family protein [Deltaproteobacteria bacterium]|nr:tautomerase family protein [Deltaproteobacteria bacterium]